jgi:Uma2 family endonuclease
MVADPAHERRMSAAAYLAWEREQPDRHEFSNDVVFAMAGGSPRHNDLGLAVGSELRLAVRGGRCRVFSSDQRIAAREGEHYVYADATIVCGSRSGKLRPRPKSGGRRDGKALYETRDPPPPPRA